MPDILRVTTPLPSQDGPGRIRPDMPQPERLVQTVTDPTRVTQPNAQDVYTDREAGKFLPNYESNYEMFLQMLRETPDMLEELRTLFLRPGQLVSSGLEAGIAEEIASYMELLQMDEAQLLQFVKRQLGGAVKFSGPFFDILRGALSASASPELYKAAAAFLKSYDSLAASQHILNELLANLQSMAAHMPKSAAEELLALARGLDTEVENGGQGESLEQMRQSILPFLSRYVAVSHDYGPVRDFITMFVLNLTRYEAGTMENFSRSLQTLLSFSEMAGRLPGVDGEALQRALAAVTRDDNALADKLVGIIARGLGGEAAAGARPVFENILRAMLVNESVYMPLLHAMIPAQLPNGLFFSEIWVDPDADEGYRREGYERAVKVLLKFDIQRLGCFELILLQRGNGLDVQLYAPPYLQRHKGTVRDAIAEIALRNDLKLNSLTQEPALKPKSISEVFPKLYERKNAVNVVI